MAKPHSVDLRERVVTAIEKGGLSRARGGVSVRRWDQHGYLGSALPADRECGAGASSDVVTNACGLSCA